MQSAPASALRALFFAAAFLFFGRDLWLVREVAVSVGLRSSATQTCEIFWSERADAPFTPEQSRTIRVEPGGVPARITLPSRRLGRLRIDFGDGTVPIRASSVRVSGKTSLELGWNDFAVRHDIGRFEIDAKRALDVDPAGPDPYAVCVLSPGVEAETRVNLFAALCLLLFALLAWWPLAGPNGLLVRPVPQTGERLANTPFLFFAALLVFARLGLTAGIPPWFGNSPWDDGWFVSTASELSNGRWLGDYDELTLIKGCFGPMVMACSNLAGIPFLMAETLLYVGGCAFTVLLLSRWVRNRLFLVAAFALLLFNPLSCSLFTWQRVYRNGMPLWQVPVVTGCFFLLYLSRRETLRRLLPAVLLSGVSMWAFLNTREDGVWLLPYAATVMAASAFGAWKAGVRPSQKTARAAVCLLPLLVVLAGNAALCFQNWRRYGLPLRNDRDGGNYALAMRDLYLIEPDPGEEARLNGPEHEGHYHNIYESTLRKAYRASPTLESASPQIESAINAWAFGQGNMERDLELDHVLFAIRDGVAAAGHYDSLPHSEAFFGRVHHELEAAFENGSLARRGVSVTAMAAPFRSEFVPRIFREWRDAILFVAAFRGTGARVVVEGDARVVRRELWNRFEEASGERLAAAHSRHSLTTGPARVAALSRLYSSLMWWSVLLATVGYVVWTTVVATRFRRCSRETVDWWLFATGVLASVLLHTACIAYMTATTFCATTSHYLAGSFQLALLFVTIVAAAGVRAAEATLRERKRGVKGTA